MYYNYFNIMAHIKQKQDSQGDLDKEIEKEVKQSYGLFGPSIFEQQSSVLITQKSVINNNEQLPPNITKIFQKMQQKIETLQHRLTTVQTQNKQLKQAFDKFSQQHQSTKQKQQQKYIKDIKRLKDQLELYQQYNDETIQKIGNKCEVQESKIMGLGDYIEKIENKHGMRKIKSQSQSQANFHNNNNKKYIGEISRLSIQSKGFKDVQRSRSFLNCSKIQDLNLPPVTLRSVPISPNCLNSKFFNIEVAQSLVSLTYCGDSGTWTHILSSDPIPVSKILQFVYKISKSTLNSISVGIIDKKYQRLRFCGKNEVNCIFYYGGSGRLWEAGRKLEKEGKGFKQGDTLIMLVYLQQGFIRWYVNGRLEAQYDNRQLFMQGKGKDIDWVAFINMSTNKDKILWQVGQLN